MGILGAWRHRTCVLCGHGHVCRLHVHASGRALVLYSCLQFNAYTHIHCDHAMHAMYAPMQRPPCPTRSAVPPSNRGSGLCTQHSTRQRLSGHTGSRVLSPRLSQRHTPARVSPLKLSVRGLKTHHCSNWRGCGLQQALHALEPRRAPRADHDIGESRHGKRRSATCCRLAPACASTSL